MLTKSPFVIGLKSRFARRQGLVNGYSAFTTAFDEIIDASDLPFVLRKETRNEAKSFKEAARRFESEFCAERITIGAAAAKLVRDLQAHFPPADRAKLVVSFLIDNSKSMAGLGMLSALIAVDVAVDAMAKAGIDTEILGFTTVNWRGGRARRAWRWGGRPRNPGRLCELRHIIYGAVDRAGRFPRDALLALRTDILHENVDGEALEWAASRLDPSRWDRRVICLISDGAPVDDSTLLANEDPEVLTRHLETTEHRLREAGIVVGFLLIGQDHNREPDLCEKAAEPEAAGLSLLALVHRALLSAIFEAPISNA
ncbi:cobaltochelatase CobT-related protein [Acidisphaera sp. S103]|uniref:cobaltochelatase CobT-related protein n=1 Tax=Acidisphaera sp. S103 TaxID=1747223 RepID=UPI00131D5F12|nr:hypothetical protein [Acidisphaera sp. S103]